MWPITAGPPDIAVRLTLDEARRIGDLNNDISEAEIIHLRRKVRDAVRDHAARHTLQGPL
jgi:hypothetical protein